MKNKYFFLVLFIVGAAHFVDVYAQDTSANKHHDFKKIKVDPARAHLQTVITHAYYTIGYFEKYRIPLWTYYNDTKEMMLSCLLDRKGSFRKDPLSNTIQASDDDYAMPFEKGHLVPCEPMTFNELAMKETFYYTNCVPQYEKVNSGRWRTLEKLVNNWTIDNLELMIFTGNVVNENSQQRGPHDVVVPDFCFKVVLDYRQPEIKAIAFIVPNKDEKLRAIKNYIKTIDEVEQLTGFDFFADLPKEEQEKFESVSDAEKWDWKVGKYDQLFKNLKKN